MRLLYFLTLCLQLASSALRAEETFKNPLQDIIAQSGFCVAYAIRDADARDIRPNTPGDPLADPSGEDLPPVGILRTDSLIDVAALTSRVVAQGRVSKNHLTAAYKAIIDGKCRFPVKECYDPHHAMVFYSNGGKPLCCIEICFSCNRVKISPEFRNLDSTDRLHERTDLIALARVFDELKLPLIPFKSFEEFRKRQEPLGEVKSGPESK